MEGRPRAARRKGALLPPATHPACSRKLGFDLATGHSRRRIMSTLRAKVMIGAVGLSGALALDLGAAIANADPYLPHVPGLPGVPESTSVCRPRAYQPVAATPGQVKSGFPAPRTSCRIGTGCRPQTRSNGLSRSLSGSGTRML